MTVIAEAFALVRPDLKGFADELRLKLPKEIAKLGVGVRTVPLKASFEANTRRQLATFVREMAPIPVQVRPVLAPGARAEIQRRLVFADPPTVAINAVLAGGQASKIGKDIANAATTTTATGTAGTGAAAAGVGAKTAATKAEAAAAERVVAINNLLQRSEEGVAKGATDAAAASTHVTTAQRAEKEATAALVAAQKAGDAEREAELLLLQQKAQELTRVARAQELLRVASAGAGNATGDVAAADASAKAHAENVIALEAEQAARKANAAALLTENAQLRVNAAAVLAEATANRKATETKLESAAASKAQVAIDTRLANIQANVSRARSPEGKNAVAQAKDAARASLAANKEAALVVAAVTAAESKASEAQIKRALALEAESAALVIDTKEEIRNAEAKAKNAVSTKAAARGASATAASFLGLRGAVLSATGPFLAATIAVTAFAKIIGVGASLEQALNTFRAITHATAEEMDAVSAAAQRLGKDITLPGVSATDAAQAITELAKAGLSVQASIAGAKGVLQLATAASIDNASATLLVASALNAYTLAGNQAVHVADLFTNAANASQGSIEDIGLAFQQVAAVARQTGISLEDTTAILTLFARNGLRGSDAGTSLRTALIRLISPTKEAGNEIASLGLQIRDAQGNVRPDIFAQFGEATKNLSADVRDAFAADIFGQDAIRAAAIGAREGAAGLNEARAALAQEGAAADVAAAKTQGLSGQANALGSNIETAAGNISKVFIPALTELVRVTNIAVTGLNSFFEVTGKIAHLQFPGRSALGGLGKELLLFGTPFVGPILATTNAIKVLGDQLGDTGGKAARTSLDARDAIESARALAAKVQSDVEKFGRPQNQPLFELPGQNEGLKAAGNIDLLTRKIAKLRDGSIATVKSVSVATDIGETLIPQVIDGKIVSLNKAIAHFRKTGENLGSFDSVAAANAYAERLHQQQEKFYAAGRGLGQTTAQGISAGLLDGSDREDFNAAVKQNIQQVDVLQRSLIATAGSLAKIDPGAPAAEALRVSVNKMIADLASLGSRGAAVLRQAGATLAPILGEQLEGALADFTGVDFSSGEIPEAVTDLIDQLALLGPKGATELRGLGATLRKALAAGISDGDDPTVAARKSIKDAVDGAAKQLQDSIRSARSNFDSLGDTIASSLEKIIDSGPIQRQIDKIDAALDKLQKKTSARKLSLDVSDAQTALDQAQRSIIRIGPQSADQNAAIEKFLRPFRDDLENAKVAQKEFNLETKKSGLEDLKEKAKKAATEGIEKLVAQFESGKITAQQFTNKLRQQVQPAIAELAKNKNLGLSFSKGFLHDVTTIVQQAKDLAGFLGVPGTDPGSQSVSPAAARAAGAKNIAEARANLQKTIRAQENTASNTDAMKKSLAAIERALAPKTPKTKTTTPGANGRGGTVGRGAADTVSAGTGG